MTAPAESPAVEAPAPTEVERCRPRKECWALYNAREDDWAKHDFRMASCSGCWVRGPVGPTLPLVPEERPLPRTDLSQVEGRGKRGDRTFRTTALATALSSLEPIPYQLLSALMYQGDSDGGNAFPSIALLQEKLGGWSRKRVERWLRVLEAEGWIERIAFTDRRSGRRTSSLYRFRIPRGLPEGGREGAVCWSKRPAGFEPSEAIDE